MSEDSKNILVVGGNSGVGKKLVESLSSAGHSLTIAVRNPDALDPTPTTPAQRFDATDASCDLDLPVSLDGLIYLPGTINLKPFHRITPEEFTEDMQVNFFGAVRVIQQALPSLKKCALGKAAIVLFSTVAATTGMPFHASIASAKAAIEGLTRSLAAELAPRIRVNAVAPSLTDTPLASQLLANDDRAKAAAKRHPLQRIGDPAETADLVKFLISDVAGFISGQVIGVDGGLSTLRPL